VYVPMSVCLSGYWYHCAAPASVFKVFIEYAPNLGSVCISVFYINLTFDKTLMIHFFYFV